MLSRITLLRKNNFEKSFCIFIFLIQFIYLFFILFYFYFLFQNYIALNRDHGLYLKKSLASSSDTRHACSKSLDLRLYLGWSRGNHPGVIYSLLKWLKYNKGFSRMSRRLTRLQL